MGKIEDKAKENDKTELRREREFRDNESNKCFNAALAEIETEFVNRKPQKNHLMYVSRIQRAIEIMPLKRKYELERWLHKHLQRAKAQQARLGVARKACYCGDWFYNPDKYMKHIAHCAEYAKHAIPPTLNTSDDE